MENVSSVQKQGGRVRRKLKNHYYYYQETRSSALDVEQSHPTLMIRDRGLSDLSLLPGDNNPQEIQNFLFFRTVTAPSLAGGCDFGLWTCHTLQASRLYPPLWHATTALGAIHRQFIADGNLLPYNPRSETVDRVRFALRQFNESIQSLTKMLSSGKALGKQDKVVVLTSCILFMCLCTLQGYQLQALMHISHGVKLMHEWGLGESSVVQRDDTDAALNMLLVMLTQLDTQGTHIQSRVGIQTTEQIEDRQSVYALEPFHTCLQAYVGLEKLINRLTRLDLNTHGASATHKEAILHDFTLWDAMFQDYLATRSETIEGNLLAVLNIRRLYAQTLFNDPAKGEVGYDEFIDQYTMIVTLAAQVLEAIYPDTRDVDAQSGNVSSPSKQPDYSLSVVISEAIFITAMRCREPSLRRRALQLLKRYPRREGIMNGTAATEILENYMLCEEQTCTGSLADNGRCSSDGLWICQKHRVDFQRFMDISRLGVQGMQKWRT
ncbi:hypothetical protein UA08_05840 [Talaromyces atroroseus]|uniref:Zn(2)-C6 fungal-type domain-containing protein n=1 Tax=Talaromyces atroroseus TaxID=1441469 RepID=A0A225AVU9_TALAT|nr:hypothetical protein UA08_05840 [Talaromyces atroroseus]OKL59086.1 hypothetical protein UA08_05840 [Talaromyces atroroseus]